VSVKSSSVIPSRSSSGAGMISDELHGGMAPAHGAQERRRREERVARGRSGGAAVTIIFGAGSEKVGIYGMDGAAVGKAGVAK